MLFTAYAVGCEPRASRSTTLDGQQIVVVPFVDHLMCRHQTTSLFEFGIRV